MIDKLDEATHYPALGYKVKPRVFDISRGMNFVSLKDQIIRGRWFIDALISAGNLSRSKPIDEHNSDNFDLLIIGAGAAGVSAALRAQESKVRTLIVDRAEQSFARQEHSERLISLSLYDWPAGHWDKGSWPHAEPVTYRTSIAARYVLSGPATTGSVVAKASDMAKKWRTQFDSQLLAFGSYVEFKKYCGLHSVRSIRYSNLRPDCLDVKLAYTANDKNNSGKQFCVTVQYVLFALGPSPENTSVGCYEGQPFWAYEASNKPKQKRRTYDDCLKVDPICFSGKSPSNYINLLISGGGDSALQDFLRAVLLPHYHDLQKVVEKLKNACYCGEFEQLEHEILAAVWQTERARQLSGTSQDIDAALHRRIAKAVDDFVMPVCISGKPHSSGSTSFSSDIASAIGSMLRSPTPNIKWLIDTDPYYFKGNYALNRFLCTLLLKYFHGVKCASTIMVESGKLEKVCRNATGRLEAEWNSLATPPVVGKNIFDEVIVHHGPSKHPKLLPVSWRLRPNLRYRGLRKVFERLAQPFKPIV